MNTHKPVDENSRAGGLAAQSEPEENWIAVLRDGTDVLIRPIHKQDIELERRFIERMSPRSRRFRFLAAMRSPSEELLKKMTSINPATDVAYIALIMVDAAERQIGVARLSATPHQNDCEFAVTVSDEWQKKGLGTLLMKHLLEAARARGIETMYSNDAADNESMRRFADHLGLQHQRDAHDMTQITYSIQLKQPTLNRNMI